MIVKIIIVSLVTVILSASIKKYNQEIGNYISVTGGIIVFILCAGEISELISSLTEIYEIAGNGEEYVKLVFKIIGIGYIVEFTADIAEDFGDKVISSRVILGGKLIICGMAIPVIKKLLFLVSSML